MSDLSKHKDQFLLFVEAGFIAVNQSDEDSALKLFHAARLLNKESALPSIGIGYLHLCKLELKKAIEDFQKVLHADPKNDMAKAMLGISMSLTKDGWKEGEKVLKETAHSNNKDIQSLSNASIDLVEKFVKKPNPQALMPPPEKSHDHPKHK
jgi:tetratricopeptide (TPR) repeat protein